MNSFVVYTAITNGYDSLKEPPPIWQGQADFVAFLESAPAVTNWSTRPICRQFKDPCRNAKIHKILPHRYFSDAEYSLWIDGSILVRTPLPLMHLVEKFLKESDIALFKHRWRNCIYAEAVACLRGKADSPAVIDTQMQKYCDEGYPPNNGLVECGVILRRHSKKIQQFNEAWYAEICDNSRRDQLSFNYVAHKMGIKMAHFPGTLSNSTHFHLKNHLRNSQRL